MVDYNKIKTPYFEIRVGPSNASDSDMILLPSSLHKLVEKVEILESITSDTCLNSKIELVFREGSREPFRNNFSADTSELYGPEAELTNNSGMLTDLRFIQQGGSLKLTSKAADLIGKAQDLFNISFDENDEDAEVIEAKAEPQPVRYLFQERNRINVTWGYLEDKKNSRTIRGYITVVASNFPENSQPTTTITCLTGGYALDQLSSGTGIQFYNSYVAGASEDGKDLKNYIGLTVPEILQKFKNEWGIKLTVSEEFLNASPPKDKAITLSPDKSPAEFIRDLARQVNAVSEFRVDADGNDHLVFLSRQDFNGLILNDLNALTYKAPGSILKSVSIIGDFAKGKGYKGSYIDNEGKLRSAEAQFDDGKTRTVLFSGSKTAEQVDTDPTSNNPIKVAKEFQSKTSKNTATIPYTKIHPRTEDKSSLVDTAKAISEKCNTTLVTMEFMAYGYPLVRPGAALFNGIGNRFSGLYSILNVTHTIDSKGYTIRGNAKTDSIFDGGVQLPGGTKLDGNKTKSKQIDLFEDSPVSLNRINNPSDIGKNLLDNTASSEDTYKKYSKLQLS